MKKRKVIHRNKQKNKSLGESIFSGFDVVQIGSSIKPLPIEFISSVRTASDEEPSSRSLAYVINRDLERLNNENKHTLFRFK